MATNVYENRLIIATASELLALLKVVEALTGQHNFCINQIKNNIRHSMFKNWLEPVFELSSTLQSMYRVIMYWWIEPVNWL